MATANLNHPANSYTVIHPLHDVEEQKCATEGLAPLKMTPGVKISLLVLRPYLLLMTLMLVYRVAEVSGLLGR